MKKRRLDAVREDEEIKPLTEIRREDMIEKKNTVKEAAQGPQK